MEIHRVSFLTVSIFRENEERFKFRKTDVLHQRKINCCCEFEKHGSLALPWSKEKLTFSVNLQFWERKVDMN